jgi:hypothetical protein
VGGHSAGWFKIRRSFGLEERKMKPTRAQVVEAMAKESANAINFLGTDYVLRGQLRPYQDLWEKIGDFLAEQNNERN